MSKNWRENPLPLIEKIQAMITNMKNKNEKQELIESNDYIFKKIKSLLNSLTRFLLKNWIIPKCYEAIAYREKTKPFINLIIYKYRQYLRKISQMMAYKEGRNPEPDVI